MYSWILGITLVIIAVLFLFESREGFITVNPDSLLAQRQQLQLEGERRYNDLARVQDPSSTVSQSDVDQSIRQTVPVPTNRTASLLTTVATSAGFGGRDDGSNKSGAWVEQTGVVTQKINFCESLPVNCDFTDPRMAECGFCHKGGVNSKGQAWRGGMYISSDDQIRANQAPGQAAYSPTVGTCNPAHFTLVKDRCLARENQLQCETVGAPSSNNVCAQCYGSSGSLLFVGPKPQKFVAYLHMSHPGSNSVGGVSAIITTPSGKLTLAPSTKTVLDPQTLTLNIAEGDTISIQIFGVPPVWCAWLSNESGTRTVGIDIGEQSISPAKALGVVGDKKSLKVSNTLAKASDQSLVTPFLKRVPNNIMWYGRGSVLPGVVLSAWYGTTPTSGISVTDKIRGAAGPVTVSAASLGGDAGSDKYLWVKMDNGRAHVMADGESFDRRFFYSALTLVSTCPASLMEPKYEEDAMSCPSGPLIFTEIGSGLMGSHSCYDAKGAFNPSKFCLQELFLGAGGKEQGTLYPNTDDQAKMLAQGAGGTIDGISAFLNNLGSIATYGQTASGAVASFADYVDASMKMLGTTPTNLCDGPNANTGPHTNACLDLLWRTSGDAGEPGKNSPYKFCAAAGTKAPLNADGTPNEDNIAIANDKGGVGAVKAYYKSMYDAARDTSNFDTWSKAMKVCYNSTVKDQTSAEECNVPGDMGCWWDTWDRALKNEIGYGHTRKTCEAVAKQNNSEYYSLQDVQADGKSWCATSRPGDAYNRFGSATTTTSPQGIGKQASCAPGGGPWINHVFKNGAYVVPPPCSAPNCVDWRQSTPGQPKPACGERVSIFGHPNFNEYNFSIPVGEWRTIDEIRKIPGNNGYTIYGGDGNVSMIFPDNCGLKLTINNGPNFSGPVTLVFTKTCAQSLSSGSCGQNDYARLTQGKPWNYAQSIRCERV